MSITVDSEKAAPQGLSRMTSLILASAMFMEMMDATVIATALPAIAADIGTNPVSLKLALTSYLVALAVFIPISGWLADRIGARNLLSLAIVVFIIGSIACAFSHSLGAFVISRFIQGMGGSMMTPVARILLVRNTPRDQLVSAMAWIAMPALVGPMLGPPIGGFLTTYLSWEWIFFVNVPIGLLGLVMIRAFIPRLGIRRKTPLDLAGFILVAAAFAGIVFGLSILSVQTISPVYGVMSTVIGVIAGFAYWHRAVAHPTPILDPAIFRHRLFAQTIFGGSIFRLGVAALPFLLPLMLQVGFGFTPAESGLITLASALGAFGFKFIAQFYYRHFGLRWALTSAVFGAAVTLGLLGFVSPQSALVPFLAILLLCGLMRSAFFTITTAMAMADVEDDETGQASALVSVFQNISIALAVALAGTILQVSSDLRGEALGLPDFRIALTIGALLSASAILLMIRTPVSADRIMSARDTARTEKHE